MEIILNKQTEQISLIADPQERSAQAIARTTEGKRRKNLLKVVGVERLELSRPFTVNGF